MQSSVTVGHLYVATWLSLITVRVPNASGATTMLIAASLHSRAQWLMHSDTSMGLDRSLPVDGRKTPFSRLELLQMFKDLLRPISLVRVESAKLGVRNPDHCRQCTKRPVHTPFMPAATPASTPSRASSNTSPLPRSAACSGEHESAVPTSRPSLLAAARKMSGLGFPLPGATSGESAVRMQVGWKWEKSSGR